MQSNYLHFSYQNQLSEGGRLLREQKLEQMGMSLQISDGKRVVKKNVNLSALKELQESSKSELRSKSQKSPIENQKEDITKKLQDQVPEKGTEQSNEKSNEKSPEEIAQLKKNLNYGIRPQDMDFQQEMSSLQWMNIRNKKNQNKSLQRELKRNQESELRKEAANPSVLVESETIQKSIKKQSLIDRDRKVQAHEMSHSRIASSLQGGLGQSVVRGTTMNYQMDSSGKAYAIGGEVKVDLRPENSTFATKKKADAIMAAALSPDRPSVQDRMVATQALQLKVNARSAEMDQQSQRTSSFLTKIKQDQEGVLSRVKKASSKTFAPTDPYEQPLKNLGDITYETKRNSIRIPKPVAPDGSVQVADTQKEVNISPALGDTEKLPFGGTSLNKSSVLSESGKVRQRINSPVVAIGGTLKTETKPVIYTSQVESYEKIKKMVGDDDKIAVRLVEREELEQMIQQQPEQYSQMEDDEYLASNISSFLATI